MELLDVAWGFAALLALVPTGYLFFLSLLSARLKPPPPAPQTTWFVIVVPSHNEETGIARTVENLLKLSWPKELFKVLVVADNCKDATAQRARAAGAEVLERTDLVKRGKGYALAYAFETVLAEGNSDAVVVVDADTIV